MMPLLTKKIKSMFGSLILLLLVVPSIIFAQESIRIMSYNVFEYAASATDSTNRNDDFRSIISAINPDILIAIEMNSQAYAQGFLNNVLNYGTNSTYSMGTFVTNGVDNNDNNVVYYKPDKFTFLSSSIVINSGNHPTYEYKLRHTSLEEIIIYGVHLTSAPASNPDVKRQAEATALRVITDAFTNGEYFIAAGDFNLKDATENAFVTFVNTVNQGYFVDPKGFDGSVSWSSSVGLSTFNIQSTFDRRFDLILNSQSIIDNGGIKYVSNSFVIGGSNGSGDIVDIPQVYKNASDHLPVYADYIFGDVLPVELVFFNGTQNGNTVSLQWRTETEVSNYGFNIERTSSSLGTIWETIGFVEGYGNSNSPKSYTFSDLNVNNSGTYYYRLKQIDNDGAFEYSDIVSVDVAMPNNYYLYQNYPNPFNTLTKIEFTVPEKQMVLLKVYNAMGEFVSELTNVEREAGKYSVDFDASGLPSGIYVYRLQAGNFITNKKMILLK